MRASSLSFATALLLGALPLHAERYGSETALTLQGTYYLAGATTTLPSGVENATYTTRRITNATILARLADEGLIDGIKGYSLVMVARAHAADGVKFFATHRTKEPVEIPSSLFSLYVEDGPTKGVALFTADGDLKDLARQTRNPAEVLQGDFYGMAVLTQQWTEKAVKTDGTIEVVELVNASGTFDGVLDDAPETGVGSLTFKLAKSKPVDLTRYGMATSGVSGGTLGGSLIIGGGSLTLGNSEGGLVKEGILVLSGENVYTGGATFTNGTLDFTSITYGGFLGATATIGELATIDFSTLNPGGTLVLSGSPWDFFSTDFTLVGPLSGGTFTLAPLSELGTDPLVLTNLVEGLSYSFTLTPAFTVESILWPTAGSVTD